MSSIACPRNPCPTQRLLDIRRVLHATTFVRKKVDYLYQHSLPVSSFSYTKWLADIWRITFYMHTTIKQHRTCAVPIIRGLHALLSQCKSRLRALYVAFTHQSPNIEGALTASSVAFTHRFVDVNKHYEPHPRHSDIGYGICASFGRHLQRPTLGSISQKMCTSGKQR